MCLRPLIPQADILKVDFERTTVGERAALVKRHQSPNCMMLAEKVETREQFVAAQHGVCVLSRVLLPAAGSLVSERNSGQSLELPAPAGSHLTARAGCS
jgi:hypothetical protein